MAYLGDKIKAIVEAEAPEYGLFLVGDNVSPGNYLLRFYMDAEENLIMQKLTEFTRHVSHLIDEADFGDKAFTFEISSPGADSPLTDRRQYGKHVGRQFEIESSTGEIFEGELKSIDGDFLNFDRKIFEKPKSKKFRIQPQTLGFEDIKKASIILSFN